MNHRRNSPAFIVAGRTFSLAATPPEYVDSFDPVKGFKRAQTDLTEIFLQLAGSLEFSGSPEPYLRHMQAEHDQIEAKYQQKYRKAPQSHRPPQLTRDSLARLCSNWNTLSPKLGLEPLTKDIGHLMRNAIKGTRGTGTMIVEILNQHQARVFDAMAGRGGKSADFDVLKSELITRLELDKTHIDDSGYSIPQRDAVSSAIVIHGVTTKLFKNLDANLKPADAESIKAAILSVFVDVGRMAQSELEAGIAEWAVDDQKGTQDQTKEIATYTPELEKSLTPAERKVFSDLLLKDRFTRSDFPALEKFYSGPYDKLTERGKTEMSRRVHAGTRSER